MEKIINNTSFVINYGATSRKKEPNPEDIKLAEDVIKLHHEIKHKILRFLKEHNIDNTKIDRVYFQTNINKDLNSKSPSYIEMLSPYIPEHRDYHEMIDYRHNIETVSIKNKSVFINKLYM